MDLIAEYANGVSELTKFSHQPEQLPLIVDVIVNPHAGFFKRLSTVSKLIAELELKLAELRRRAPRRKVEVNTGPARLFDLDTPCSSNRIVLRRTGVR